MARTHEARGSLLLLACVFAILAVGCARLEANDAFEQNARLGQGVNLGNALEAPRKRLR